jgi:hypothetical protein
MKKILPTFVATISALLLAAPTAFAQSLPTPDMSVWNSAQMKPVQQFANIAVGVVFGLAVVYGVVMVAWYGIKLQGSGSDPIKSQDAKNGLKSTIIGVLITLGAIFIIGLVLYVLGVVGIKTS